jgi:hypothetical protein
MKRSLPPLCAALLLCAALVNVMAQQNGNPTANPPAARKVPKSMTTNGDTRVDNYFWLREKSNPEVVSYLEAENAYTTAYMKPTEEFQQKLYAELLGRIKQTDTNVPYRLGDYFYYTRTEEGKQYPIFCRKRLDRDAREEVTLDVNELAKGQKFMSIGAYSVSDDGNLLAYSTDSTGYRQYTLRVKDLSSGRLLTENIERVDRKTNSTTSARTARATARSSASTARARRPRRRAASRPTGPPMRRASSSRARRITSITSITAATSSTSARTRAARTTASSPRRSVILR